MDTGISMCILSSKFLPQQQLVCSLSSSHHQYRATLVDILHPCLSTKNQRLAALANLSGLASWPVECPCHRLCLDTAVSGGRLLSEDWGRFL